MDEIEKYGEAPNLCCICVDRVRGEELSGRLYHFYRKDGMRFWDQREMLAAILHLCDWLDYPQKSDLLRRFSSSAEAQLPPSGCPAPGVPIRRERQMSREKLLEQKGEKATFVVHVKYRQNASWQGSVTWAETQQSANFRSAMELFQLMDSAVRETLPDNPTTEEGPVWKALRGNSTGEDTRSGKS